MSYILDQVSRINTVCGNGVGNIIMFTDFDILLNTRDVIICFVNLE
jgi:hypothetical protein